MPAIEILLSTESSGRSTRSEVQHYASEGVAFPPREPLFGEADEKEI